MRPAKKIRQILQKTDYVGGTTALALTDWNGVKKYNLWIDVTTLTLNGGTNVVINFREKHNGKSIVGSGESFTLTATGVSVGSTPKTPHFSLGSDAEVVVTFTGGTSPVVSFDLYVVEYLE